MTSTVHSDSSMNMGELMRQTGVSRATIYHYVELGLLPRPHRPNRRMAYYDSSCVERVRTIKKLQVERFLPLHAVKRILEDGGTTALAEVDGRLLAALDPSGEAMPLAELRARYPLDEHVLGDLVAAGLLASKTGPFDPDEVAIIAAVQRMREAGLDERRGFAVAQLAFYRQSLEQLMAAEMAVFNEQVLGQGRPQEIATMAQAGIDAASELLAALHRRLLRERVQHLKGSDHE